MERAAIVIGGRAEVVEFQDNGFAARCGGVARRGVTADPVVSRRTRNGVIDVNVVVRGEVRIECNPKQAAFTGRIDRDAQEWCAKQRAVLDHAHLAALEADKEPSIGRKCHRGWRA